jgi:hypothetical protein
VAGGATAVSTITGALLAGISVIVEVESVRSVWLLLEPQEIMNKLAASAKALIFGNFMVFYF